MAASNQCNFWSVVHLLKFIVSHLIYGGIYIVKIFVSFVLQVLCGS